MVQKIKKHFGVYGIGQNQNGEILLIIKSRGEYTGLLDLPGGSPENNDENNSEKTVKREVLEETGYSVKSLNCLGGFKTNFQCKDLDGEEYTLCHTGYHYILELDFLNKEEPSDPQDAAGIIWLDPHKIESEKLTPSAQLAVDFLKTRQKNGYVSNLSD